MFLGQMYLGDNNFIRKETGGSFRGQYTLSPAVLDHRYSQIEIVSRTFDKVLKSLHFMRALPTECWGLSKR